MAEGVDTIARHTFSKERQPQAMSDTISLISHPSKIMLGVILNQLKAKAEELLAEEQAGFQPGRTQQTQKLKRRRRTGSSHSGAIRELQQCSPLE